MRLIPLKAALATAAIALAAGLAWAQIERLNLAQMIGRADNAVEGTIIERRVFRVDHPKDGPELYYTTLKIQGVSLYDGSALTVDVTFKGGFISPTEGASNSEAPKADDVRLGNRVVAFYRWVSNFGGDVACNALYAAHGGLYRVMETRNGPVVLGRGEGYAIENNARSADLRQSITALAKQKQVK